MWPCHLQAVSLQFLSSLAPSHYNHAQKLYIAEIVVDTFVWLFVALWSTQNSPTSDQFYCKVILVTRPCCTQLHTLVTHGMLWGKIGAFNRFIGASPTLSWLHCLMHVYVCVWPYTKNLNWVNGFHICTRTKTNSWSVNYSTPMKAQLWTMTDKDRLLTDGTSNHTQ